MVISRYITFNLVLLKAKENHFFSNKYISNFFKYNRNNKYIDTYI